MNRLTDPRPCGCATTSRCERLKALAEDASRCRAARCPTATSRPRRRSRARAARPTPKRRRPPAPPAPPPACRTPPTRAGASSGRCASRLLGRRRGSRRRGAARVGEVAVVARPPARAVDGDPVVFCSSRWSYPGDARRSGRFRASGAGYRSVRERLATPHRPARDRHAQPVRPRGRGRLARSAEAVVGPLSELLARARGRDDVSVIWVNDNYEDFSATRDDIVRKALAGSRPDLVDPLVPPDDCAFLQKVRHSAFYGTALDHHPQTQLVRARDHDRPGDRAVHPLQRARRLRPPLPADGRARRRRPHRPRARRRRAADDGAQHARRGRRGGRSCSSRAGLQGDRTEGRGAQRLGQLRASRSRACGRSRAGATRPSWG